MQSRIATTPQEYAAQRADDLVAELQHACRFPSVSTTGDPGLAAMAGWLRDRLATVLDSVDLVDVPGSAPAVLGHLQGTGSHTVLLYSHYDVQPVEPAGSWTSPPFAAEVDGARIIARGVVDDKADILARLHALEAWRATRGPLPFSVVWLSEGGEEIGSPGLDAFVRDNRERLRADACLWESYLRAEDGTPELIFGCRGLVYVELSLDTLAVDQHSSYATIFRSATGELAKALASLTDADGRCAIGGFHDGIEPLDDAALTALATNPIPDSDAAALPGRSPLRPGGPEELRRRFVMEPTCNIAGMSGGHTAEGMKTVVAAEARARVDFRIVPGQNPDTVVARLREHLDDHGFGDVAITVLSTVRPYRGPMVFPLADAVARAARELMGEPVLRPIIPGTGPLHQVAGTLGIPVVGPPGAFRMSSLVHAPDENIVIADYLDTVAFVLRTFELLGAGPD